MEMRRGGRLALLICVLIALPLAYAGWRNYLDSGSNECYACARSIHAHSMTVALVDGRARRFCCPACALAFRRQNGGPVNITQLSAYPNGAPLSPANAYIVKGSGVNLCERSQGMIDADKRPVDLQYDRCAPSMIAFASRAEAVEFARQNGGETLPFREAAEAAPQTVTSPARP
jgi:hypothetical protein